VAVVFLATVAASSQTPALRVVSAGPTGDLGQLADADDVRIVFSEPMIDLGVVPTGAAPSWMRLTPAVPGTFYWSGTRTLMFSPDANTPIPNATMFTVRVEGSATSVTGRTLGAPFEFSSRRRRCDCFPSTTTGRTAGSISRPCYACASISAFVLKMFWRTHALR